MFGKKNIGKTIIRKKRENPNLAEITLVGYVEDSEVFLLLLFLCDMFLLGNNLGPEKKISLK